MNIRARRCPPLRAALVLALCLTAPISVVVGEPTPAVQTQIDHLLTYMERSGCRFFRNGAWYSSAEAKNHLARKYAYLRGAGSITDAENFITLAATRSSTSGNEYRVQCGDGAALPAGAWLKEELLRYRQQKRGKMTRL